MKRIFTALLLPGLTMMLLACAGGGTSVSVGVYRHHHVGPWWGIGGYYRERIIVVPPETVEPEFEATPLPSGPDEMPDMGMPDVDLGDF